MRSVPRLQLLAMMAICLVIVGCGRRHYRLRADTDALALVNEKSQATPWQLPRSYSVYPDPDSRLADPTDPDFPLLPEPGPLLYSGQAPAWVAPEEPLPAAGDESLPEPKKIDDLDHVSALRRLPRLITQVESAFDGVMPVSFQAAGEEAGLSPPLPDDAEPMDQEVTELPIQPVPADSWNVLPQSCLQHMLEFDSVLQEYRQTFPSAEPPRPSAPKRRLGLSQIVDLAVRNSREYQTEEERLYVAALDVSLQRYDYQLKFSRSGNGIDTNYNYARVNDQISSHSLAVPSTTGVEKTLARGGTFISRFANEVILDFNGSQGLTSRISSDLLFGFTQSILQRDILLDPLIQSERSLVYAVRSFARFRKQFFFGVASDYYDILSTYRRVEIESQNYFSLVRTLEQARAEVRAGVKTAPNQVAVDQFEQGVLSGRSTLIATTNGLEQSLDRLKITLGLPTDLPLDINLRELDQLTLLDEIAVAVERVRRWRRRVEEQLNRRLLQRPDLVNAGIYMIERIREWAELQRRHDGRVPDLSEIDELDSRLRLEQSHYEVERNQEQYDAVTAADVKEPTILVFLRATVLLEARLSLVGHQLTSLQDRGTVAPQLLAETDRDRRQAIALLGASRKALEQNPSDDELDAMVDTLRPTLDQMTQLAARLDRLLQYEPDRAESIRDEQALADTKRLLEVSARIIEVGGAGLPDIDIDVHDAMLTALIQRLDLMNERGFLADDWRRIKFASDDLRSVLNLSAQQRLRTVNDEQPFNPLEFDLDSTETDVRVSLDLPLNRRAQRNAYRRTLINYQQGRRSLMQLEDNIKFEIRNELRSVELIRVQYPIQVTRAALAAEQVTSIRLQLALGTPNVRGTDLLDALQGSREALTLVANLRIGDLVNRAQFVLDMELMQLDENGFWPPINDADYQPQPNLMYPPSAGPTYGEIPRGVKPTRLMYHLYAHRRPGEQIEQITAPLAEPEPEATD